MLGKGVSLCFDNFLMYYSYATSCMALVRDIISGDNTTITIVTELL